MQGLKVDAPKAMGCTTPACLPKNMHDFFLLQWMFYYIDQQTPDCTSAQTKFWISRWWSSTCWFSLVPDYCGLLDEPLAWNVLSFSLNFSVVLCFDWNFGTYRRIVLGKDVLDCSGGLSYSPKRVCRTSIPLTFQNKQTCIIKINIPFQFLKQSRVILKLK